MAVFDPHADPLSLFADWMADAEAKEPSDPNAMALATVDEFGLPDVRIVLLKSFGVDGFVFYTNRASTKGRQLSLNARAALAFHWKSMGRQVRLRGSVEDVSAEDADAYFKSRPKGSRIGAWASKQSQPLESRFALERAVAKYTARYGLGEVPRPDHWGGYRVIPETIEFWQAQTFRLHDRIRFTRTGDGWEGVRLYP